MKLYRDACNHASDVPLVRDASVESAASGPVLESETSRQRTAPKLYAGDSGKDPRCL